MTRFDLGWEADLDRRLRRLPYRRAPSTLGPRILAAARQPAWLRRWSALPMALRVAVALAAGAAALALLRLEAAAALRLWEGASHPWLTVARALWAVLGQAARGAATLWWAWRGPLAAAALASMTACAAAAVLAAVLMRQSERPVSRSRA